MSSCWDEPTNDLAIETRQNLEYALDPGADSLIPHRIKFRKFARLGTKRWSRWNSPDRAERKAPAFLSKAAAP